MLLGKVTSDGKNLLSEALDWYHSWLCPEPFLAGGPAFSKTCCRSPKIMIMLVIGL